MTLVLYKPLCFSRVNHVVVMLTSPHLHGKDSEVCIKTRSPSASRLLKGQVTQDTTVKWAIENRSFCIRLMMDFLVRFRFLIINGGDGRLQKTTRSKQKFQTRYQMSMTQTSTGKRVVKR